MNSTPALEDGSWLHPGKVTDLFERLVATSGLPPIRLHDLRHDAATLMLATSIDVKIVSDTLGHSDTRITLDIYQDPRELHLMGEKPQVARSERCLVGPPSSCNLAD